MGRKVEVQIESIRVSLVNQGRVVLLKDVEKGRILPLMICSAETEMLMLAIQEIALSRPVPHDILKNAITQLGGRPAYTEIYEYKSEIYYSRLVVTQNNEPLYIECRPSDAVSLAVRCHIPLLVDEDILEQAGITAERDIRLSPNDSKDDDDLSAFSSFFNTMNGDDDGRI